MSVYGKRGFVYDNGDATAVLKGCGLKRSSEAKVALATAITDVPLGVSLESGNRFETISVETVSGEFVKAVAGAAITGGAVVRAGTGAKFVTATKLAGGGITVGALLEYVWGMAWSLATADLDLFTLLQSPVEVEQ